MKGMKKEREKEGRIGRESRVKNDFEMNTKSEAKMI